MLLVTVNIVGGGGSGSGREESGFIRRKERHCLIKRQWLPFVGPHVFRLNNQIIIHKKVRGP